MANNDWLTIFVIFFGLLFALGGFSAYQTCAMGGGTLYNCVGSLILAVFGVILILYVVSKST
jgi:hypothetical protein